MAPGGPAGSVTANPRMTLEMKEKWLDRWCLEDSKDPAAILRMFGGWSGVLNCERDGLEAFFSEQGGPNFLPGFLGVATTASCTATSATVGTPVDLSSRWSRSDWQRPSPWPRSRSSSG